MSVDDLEEKITAFEDYVQSMVSPLSLPFLSSLCFLLVSECGEFMCLVKRGEVLVSCIRGVMCLYVHLLTQY